MPRAFSAEERARIRDRLMRVGRARFEKHGIRRTSVDELAKSAGISKGAFYAFFDSKEALFLAILDQVQNELREPLLVLAREDRPLSREHVRAQLEELFAAFQAHPFAQVLAQPEELEAVYARVPPEQRITSGRRDRRHLTDIVALLWESNEKVADVDADAVAAAMTLFVFAALNRDAFDEKLFPIARDLLIDLVSRVVFENAAQS